MANDTDWLRRSDEWIEATNTSRKRKEKRLADKSNNLSKDNKQPLKPGQQSSK